MQTQEEVQEQEEVINPIKTFQQFLEEAKAKKIAKIQKKKPGTLTKKEIDTLLNAQGGIGGKAVEKYNRENPDRGAREYKLGDNT